MFCRNPDYGGMQLNIMHISNSYFFPRLWAFLFAIGCILLRWCGFWLLLSGCGFLFSRWGLHVWHGGVSGLTGRGISLLLLLWLLGVPSSFSSSCSCCCCSFLLGAISLGTISLVLLGTSIWEGRRVSSNTCVQTTCALTIKYCRIRRVSPGVYQPVPSPCSLPLP